MQTTFRYAAAELGAKIKQTAKGLEVPVAWIINRALEEWLVVHGGNGESAINATKRLRSASESAASGRRAFRAMYREQKARADRLEAELDELHLRGQELAKDKS